VFKLFTNLTTLKYIHKWLTHVGSLYYMYLVIVLSEKYSLNYNLNRKQYLV